MSLFKEIQRLSSECEALSAKVTLAKEEYSNVKALCGQTGYGVTIAGVRVEVAEMDGRTCMAKVIRGREMIHLGALKALDARVDSYRRQLYAKAQEMADAADRLLALVKANQEKGHAE